jgi:hypothetical protein
MTISDGKREWQESYDAAKLINPDDLGRRRRRYEPYQARSIEDARWWSNQVIAWFNETRRDGEERRTLIDVALVRE